MTSHKIEKVEYKSVKCDIEIFGFACEMMGQNV